MASKKRFKSPVKRLYFDIETSPNIAYTWNVGYKVKIDYDNIIQERAIVCICWKWEGEATVNSLTWDKNQNDKDMLEQFIKVANTADEIVGHNSDKFDLPWVRTRCAYHGIPMFPNYSSLDTLKKSKSKFRFNSNRLDYIAQYLGESRKMATTFSLWKGVMRNDEACLDKMVRYCKQDVKVLEAVYKRLSPYITNSVHHGALAGSPKYSCPECGGMHTTVSKRRVTAAGTIKVQLQCQDCGKYFTISESNYKKMVEA